MIIFFLIIHGESLTRTYIQTSDSGGLQNHFLPLLFFHIRPGWKDAGGWEFMKNYNFQLHLLYTSIWKYQRDKSFSNTKFNKNHLFSQLWLPHSMNTPEIRRVQLFTVNSIWFFKWVTILEYESNFHTLVWKAPLLGNSIWNENFFWEIRKFQSFSSIQLCRNPQKSFN